MYEMEVLVPIVCVFCIFGLPVTVWGLTRYFAHKERMAMIERGLAPGTPIPRASSLGRVRQNTLDDSDCPPERTLRKGILTTSIGFALLIGLSFIGYHDGEMRPGPWLLGGLIPMFVGIAQVIVALMSGAEVPSRFNRNGWTPPPGPPPPPPADGGSSASGPYTYRPSGQFEELERPVRPPEPR